MHNNNVWISNQHEIWLLTWAQINLILTEFLLTSLVELKYLLFVELKVC